ncbi:MAG: hypothetical protein NT074_00865, partial [Methanomicrobiales archaeon]|nr:hypothetical protein [Methanomicrobiales archaeon]
TLRAAARHILDEADDADGIHLRLPFGKSVYETDDAGGACHVALHVVGLGALDEPYCGDPLLSKREEGVAG